MPNIVLPGPFPVTLPTSNISDLAAAPAPSLTDVFETQTAGGVNGKQNLGALINFTAGSGFVVFPSGDTTGVTDTATFNTLFGLMAADTSGAAHSATFTTGIYYINAKCVFTFNAAGNGDLATPYEFRGQGGVRIQQVTTNTGLWEFQVPVNGFPANINIKNIQFEALNQQTSANTASIGIGFRSVLNTGTHPGETIFGITIKECRFLKLFRGIANTQPAGLFPVWGLNVSHCNFRKLSGAAAWIVSPTSVGQPNISFYNNLCEVPYLGGSEAVWRIDGCDNASLVNLENLLFVDVPLIQLTSTSQFAIIACKGEACTYNGQPSGGNPVILCQNAYGVVDGFSLVGTTINPGTIAPTLLSVQNGGANNAVTVSNAIVDIDAGTGTLTCFSGNLVDINVVSINISTNLGTGPGVINFMSTAGGFNTGKVLQFTTYPGGAISDDIGDASIALWNGQSSKGTNVWNTPLTANRSITLPTTANTVGTNNLWNGVIVRVVRTANATGAFTLSVIGPNSGTVVVAIGGMAAFQWRLGLGWVQIQ